jgi:hypothetical protein
VGSSFATKTPSGSTGDGFFVDGLSPLKTQVSAFLALKKVENEAKSPDAPSAQNSTPPPVNPYAEPANKRKLFVKPETGGFDFTSFIKGYQAS